MNWEFVFKRTRKRYVGLGAEVGPRKEWKELCELNGESMSFSGVEY